MEDGTPTILYTKETRAIYILLYIYRAHRATEQ